MSTTIDLKLSMCYLLNNLLLTVSNSNQTILATNYESLFSYFNPKFTEQAYRTILR